LDFLAQLNPQQREAVTATEGPLLILAGAGSGKTRVIAYRIAYLIGQRGVWPRNILAVTFTNKAAEEMRKRVNQLLEGMEIGSAPLIATFHSLCVRILRRDIEALKAGYTRSFTIYDQDDTVRLTRNCLRDLGLDERQLTPRSVQSAISAAKNRGEDADAFTARAQFIDERRASIARVFALYEERLQRNNALDFDDLLIKTVRLLREAPEVRDRYNERFCYLLVDEYQDTNSLQFALVSLLTEKQQNICVVGDPDQCLTPDTLITMSDGYRKPIKLVRAGDLVMSNYGSGDLRPARVTKASKRRFNGECIDISLRSGRRLVSTPDHTHFAGYRLGIVPQNYFTYLMHKRRVGWRLGTSQVYTAGQVLPMVGFKQRLLQEHADALWIVGTHSNENEARADEYLLSLTYKIPTLPFVARKGASIRGLVHDSVYIKKVFDALDTEAHALRLLTDRRLSPDHPHHRPRSMNSDRRNAVVSLCGDRRGRTPMHRISIVGSDQEGKAQLEALGFSVRPAKKGSASWRFETANKDFSRILETVVRLQKAFDLNVFWTARLGANSDRKGTNSLPFIPASSVQPGMAMFDEDGAYDVVENVTRCPLTGTMYDLNIESTHNFIANGIITHNSIYRWRGADITNILKFEEHFPKAKVIRLEENYRSTQNILDVASGVIKHNIERKEKALWTQNPSGEKIRYFQALDAESEARFVAGKIEEHLADQSDIRAAVLYRTNSQSRVFEEAMRRASLSYNIVGGFSFYERMEVRDVIAYLKLAMNPHDTIALQRVINSPPRGIGKITLDEIERRARELGVSYWEAISALTEDEQQLSQRAIAALRNFQNIVNRLAAKINPKGRGGSPTSGSPDGQPGWGAVREGSDPTETTVESDSLVSDAVKAAIVDTGYESALKAENNEEAEARLENLQELVNAAVDYDEQGAEGLRDFIDHSALVADTDQYKSDVPVTLMTAHSAKGLEFPVVFIVGLEDGLFPHSRSLSDSSDIEEERRLCYVAMTRAERQLYITHAVKRRVYGEEMASEPSQFLNEMPLDLIEDLSRGKSWLSFARGSAPINYQPGESRKERKKYEGKTYDSADSIEEFFRKRSAQMGGASRVQSSKSKVQSPKLETRNSKLETSDFLPGSYVRHAKYGRGLVLRREGVGDSTKLTVSFPGYGQKKLMQKYANLEND
jgi:DNA helicase II / ATP-dependent DNA helicase PcrA